MTRLLVAGQLHPAGEALLREVAAQGVTVDYITEVSEASCAARIAEADALVIRTQPLGAGTIARARRLRVVSRHGVGYDSVDLEALNRRGIGLTIVGDVNSVSVAEHAMMQLLAVAKQARAADLAVRTSGQWNWRNRLLQREVSGKRLLILGYGRIGRHLARMAAGFDMEVRAFDPFLQGAGWPEGPVRPVTTLAEGLGWADCLSVHVPRAARPLLDAEAFAAMKPGMILSNTARGGVVCEAALAQALRTGQVAAAGLDVFDAEPPDGTSPLFDLPNVLLSPHIAGLTNECGERMALAAIANALDFLAGTIDPGLVVNPARATA
ncbi:hydroxyacid dehydrogenase [Pseudooceanicola sp. CBS1P-1]|uniref:3-phosphoglycerate dehydrogenase n=1 Tax=Pseudooceanicola albus TaxID=2692189 RepID=A0A6L7G864_9RHOB|nr:MULTISPECIES: hydroxyacid dehydrogenase [Pseudooceanicola]MBT9385268.1 hydroxyacid dehydrogenase [Pseudooceanicola endophyticus]MXN18873.1 3-phosphoglycerate dehydrogenase [Pseudooceanicola albus]